MSFYPIWGILRRLGMAQWEKALCLGGNPFRGSVWDRQHYDTKVNHCLNETEYILIIFWFSVYLWMVVNVRLFHRFLQTRNHIVTQWNVNEGPGRFPGLTMYICFLLGVTRPSPMYALRIAIYTETKRCWTETQSSVIMALQKYRGRDRSHGYEGNTVAALD